MTGQPDQQGGGDRQLITEPHDGHPASETCPGCPHPSAPTGDHGGLRALSEAATPGPWEVNDRGVMEAADKARTILGHIANAGDEGRANATLVAAAVNHVRSLLAAHPVPEPAQDGEVRDRAVAALIAELGDYADHWPETEAAEEFWGKAADIVLAVARGTGQ